MKWSVLLCVAAVLAVGEPASAGTIGIFGAGVDSSGNVLAVGSTDSHWSITTVPTGSGYSTPSSAVVQSPHSLWSANDVVGSAGSAWIGVTSSGTDSVAPGRYVFETTFDLTGFQVGTAQITGRMAADNIVSRVFLNGTDLGLSVEGFSFGAPFTIDSGFIAGTNTLTFWQENAGLTPTSNWYNPSGLRVELSGTAQIVPLPPAAWMGLGFLGTLGLIRRLRRRRSP